MRIVEHSFVCFGGKNTAGLLAPSYPGVITTIGIGKIVVENSRVAVPESNLHVGNPAQDKGIPLFDNNTITPLRKSKMENLVTHFEIHPPGFFHRESSSSRLGSTRLAGYYILYLPKSSSGRFSRKSFSWSFFCVSSSSTFFEKSIFLDFSITCSSI